MTTAAPAASAMRWTNGRDAAAAPMAIDVAYAATVSATRKKKPFCPAGSCSDSGATSLTSRLACCFSATGRNIFSTTDFVVSDAPPAVMSCAFPPCAGT